MKGGILGADWIACLQEDCHLMQWCLICSVDIASLLSRLELKWFNRVEVPVSHLEDQVDWWHWDSHLPVMAGTRTSHPMVYREIQDSPHFFLFYFILWRHSRYGSNTTRNETKQNTFSCVWYVAYEKECLLAAWHYFALLLEGCPAWRPFIGARGRTSAYRIDTTRHRMVW